MACSSTARSVALDCALALAASACLSGNTAEDAEPTRGRERTRPHVTAPPPPDAGRTPPRAMPRRLPDLPEIEAERSDRPTTRTRQPRRLLKRSRCEARRSERGGVAELRRTSESTEQRRRSAFFSNCAHPCLNRIGATGQYCPRAEMGCVITSDGRQAWRNIGSAPRGTTIRNGRELLPRRSVRQEDARLLRRALHERRDQLHVLPHAHQSHPRKLGRGGSRAISVSL